VDKITQLTIFCIILAMRPTKLSYGYRTLYPIGPCVLPPVTNGSIVEPTGGGPGTTLQHGSTLQYNCNEGFRPGTSTTTCCHNGTWLTTPVCLPGLLS